VIQVTTPKRVSPDCRTALAAWAQAHGGAELIERRKVKPFGVYTLVRFRRAEANSAAA
jgi:phosphatidylethanolamine/phosphatidyl-N-methylethanolamine N-methyltransferase